jgi:hypothetical protein
VPEDYIEIHDLMDSSKEVFPDNRHRALTHNAWFIFIVERVFGHNLKVTCVECDGEGTLGQDTEVYDHINGFGEKPCEACETSGFQQREVSVRDVAEQHILEDFGGKYIPSAQDYLEHMSFQEWMNNGRSGTPSSHKKIREKNVEVLNLD